MKLQMKRDYGYITLVSNREYDDDEGYYDSEYPSIEEVIRQLTELKESRPGEELIVEYISDGELSYYTERQETPEEHALRIEGVKKQYTSQVNYYEKIIKDLINSKQYYEPYKSQIIANYQQSVDFYKKELENVA